MPFFDWTLLKSRTLHPDIGIPADDTQGLPYLDTYSIFTIQNYGLAVKAQSGTNSITGYLFTANTRYLLGSGESKSIEYSPGQGGVCMFAIDSLSGHVFATTASGIINNPISISGNRLGWSGGQSAGVLSCNPQITYINYSGSNYVCFGDDPDNDFAIFKPGGVVNTYSGYNAGGVLQPINFYNGLYTLSYSSTGYASQYGFIPLVDAPLIMPAYMENQISASIISYSFTESAIDITSVNSGTYGYDGMNDPTLTSSFIKFGFPVDNVEIFGFDPVAGRLLSISPTTVTVGGHAYYPVYVYNAGVVTFPTPQQYSRPVKNYTVNGHLNWRKQR